jgi:hypothetical protein
MVDTNARAASRFYWCWLIFATSWSVLGNVAHALLVAPDAFRLLAAAASVVPSTFVLGSTHAVALGLQVRRFALIHLSGLVMTIGVAACAFFLSFDALRGLAVMLGWRPGTAWLFPIAIDVSIAQATFGLLSLTPTRGCVAAAGSTAADGSASTLPDPTPDEARSPSWPLASPSVLDDATVDAARAPKPFNAPEPVRAAIEAASVEPLSGSKRPSPAAADSPDAAVGNSELLRWKRTANELVRNGTTSKDPETVAGILAEHAAGAAPNTISRRRGVHHSTIGRILAGAADLSG